MARRKKLLMMYLPPAVAVLGVLLFARAEIAEIDAEAMALAETGKGVIAFFGECASGFERLDADAVAACYADDYRAVEGAWEEGPVDERDGVRVRSWSEGPPEPTGKAEIRERIAALLGPVESLELAKLKLARVEVTPSAEEPRAGERAVVRSFLWLRGERAGEEGEGVESFESQARLRFELARTREGGWEIVGQKLLDGRTVTGDGEGFTDVAEAAGLTHLARQNPLFDTPEWAPEKFQILRYGGAGVSAADYDGDGWDDLLFADGASPRLYRNRGDGTFEDVTAAAGLPEGLPGVNAALLVDLDNDGDRDAFLSGFTQGSRLYRNDGDGTFTDVTGTANLGRGFVTVAAAGDADGDGLLDLYLGRYLDPRTDLPTTLFYTRNSEGNSLLTNRGDLVFEDTTEEAGVREGGLTLGVAWGDFDADGDQDLYVANDFGRNALFRNRGDGTFEDVAAESDAIDFGFGMSASAGDPDNDGDLDLYVSNVHSGQRWYGQAPSLHRYLLTSCRQGTIFEDFPVYREIYGIAGRDWASYGDRMTKGNSLLVNDGTGAFTDVAEAAGANPFGWYWGSTFLDYDNDGREDLYAANGWITGETHDDL